MLSIFDFRYMCLSNRLKNFWIDQIQLSCIHFRPNSIYWIVTHCSNTLRKFKTRMKWTKDEEKKNCLRFSNLFINNIFSFCIGFLFISCWYCVYISYVCSSHSHVIVNWLPEIPLAWPIYLTVHMYSKTIKPSHKMKKEKKNN